MEKKKISNKAEKVEPEKKVSTKKKLEDVQEIFWDTLPDLVSIIAKNSKHLIAGKEYRVSKEEAKLLLEKGVAILK